MSAEADAPATWTPELERARMQLCAALVMYADERRDVPASLVRHLRQAEEALTILGEIACAAARIPMGGEP